MGYWDKFAQGDRFKFVTPGDKIEGVLTKLSTTDFGGTGDPTPVLVIRTSGGDREVTASQTVLISRLAEQQPVVDDWISITYDGEDPKGGRPGRSPAKLFTVIVKKAEGEAPPPAAKEDDGTSDPF